MRRSGIPLATLLTVSVFFAVLSFGCKSESTEPAVDVQLEKASIFPGAAGVMDIEITGDFVVRNTASPNSASTVSKLNSSSLENAAVERVLRSTVELSRPDR